MRYFVLVLVAIFALTSCSGKIGDGINDIIAIQVKTLSTLKGDQKALKDHTVS